MKKSVKRIIGATILTSALMLSGLITAHLWNVEAVIAAEADTKGAITVNGQGKISVKPDIATANLGVVTDAADAASAQAANAKIMEELLNTVKAAGIEEKDIETAYFTVDKKYDYRNYDANGQPKEVGYTTTNSITVTIRNIDNVGAILDKATAAGANQINNIQFNTSQPELYYAKAMEEAVANARSKASTLANAIGVTIGKPSSVSESSYGNVTPVYTTKESANALMAQADSSSRVTSISTGQVEISATVSAVFEYNLN